VAQERSGAEAALATYIEVTKRYDTAAIAALMHPDALKRFRTTIDTAFAGPKGDQAKRELLPLFDVTAVTAYSALSDVDAYKRMNDTVAKNAPDLIALMSTCKFEIVGTIIKDGTAHVTYNFTMTVEGRPVTTPVVQMLRQHEGRWLLMLPPTADATIARIESRYR